MVQVHSESVECKVSAERMWQGLFKDAHNCLPKALPNHVLAVEYPHAQHGFHLHGHERFIKLKKALCEEVHKEEKHIKEEEALVEGKAKKVEEAVHEKEEEVKKKAEEAEKEAKEKEKAVKKKAEEAEEEAKEKEKEVVGEAEKEAKKKEKELEKEAHLLKELLEVEAHKKDSKPKAGEKLEKAFHKEEEQVGAALHKVGAFLQHEELWIKEKIEEAEQEAHKITISVLGGGFVGTLFKHCKHTFELKDTSPHSSILHWTSEFETLPSALHHHHSSEKLKQHALTPFHNVEAYLLKHDDYAS